MNEALMHIQTTTSTTSLWCLQHQHIQRKHTFKAPCFAQNQVLIRVPALEPQQRRKTHDPLTCQLQLAHPPSTRVCPVMNPALVQTQTVSCPCNLLAVQYGPAQATRMSTSSGIPWHKRGLLVSPALQPPPPCMAATVAFLGTNMHDMQFCSIPVLQPPTLQQLSKGSNRCCGSSCLRLVAILATACSSIQH